MDTLQYLSVSMALLHNLYVKYKNVYLQIEFEDEGLYKE